MAWTADGRWVSDPYLEDEFYRPATGLLGGVTSLPTGGTPVPTPTPVPVPTPVPTPVPAPVPVAPVVTKVPGETGPMPERPPQTPMLLDNGVPPAPPAVVAPPSAIPVPTALPVPQPIVMPNAPVARDASVANQLTGLLASDSPYIALARRAGERTAGRRGLLNSSIAAGSAEAAAIAAAAPIASQDASQIQQTNQTNLESYNQLRNASTLQNAQFAMDAWKTMDSNIQQILLNNSSNGAAMERLLKQGEIESAIALMREDRALTQTQINANVSILSNYMSAFAQLAQNPDLPASARDAYIREFQSVTGAGQSLVNRLSGMTTVPPPATGGTPSTPIPPQVSYEIELNSWANGAIEVLRGVLTSPKTWAGAEKISDPVKKLEYIIGRSPNTPAYLDYLKRRPRPVPPPPTGTPTGTAPVTPPPTVPRLPIGGVFGGLLGG